MIDCPDTYSLYLFYKPCIKLRFYPLLIEIKISLFIKKNEDFTLSSLFMQNPLFKDSRK